MLKYRVITAVIVGIIFVFMMWGLRPPIFGLVTIIFPLIAAWEYSRLIGLSTLSTRIIYLLLIVLSIYFSYLVSHWWILALSFPAWCWATYVIGAYERNELMPNRYQLIIKGFFGFLILVACWKSLTILQGISPFLLLTALVLVWSVDTAAYFTGRRWGKTALAPRISPKKTWEGFWGGIIISVILMTILSCFLPFSMRQRFYFILLSVLTALFAVIGDLFISLLKRQAGVKDSGRLLPGHGGMLDRVDSSLSALPIFTMGILFIKM